MELQSILKRIANAQLNIAYIGTLMILRLRFSYLDIVLMTGL